MLTPRRTLYLGLKANQTAIQHPCRFSNVRGSLTGLHGTFPVDKMSGNHCQCHFLTTRAQTSRAQTVSKVQVPQSKAHSTSAPSKPIWLAKQGAADLCKLLQDSASCTAKSQASAFFPPVSGLNGSMGGANSRTHSIPTSWIKFCTLSAMKIFCQSVLHRCTPAPALKRHSSHSNDLAFPFLCVGIVDLSFMATAGFLNQSTPFQTSSKPRPNL